MKKSSDVLGLVPFDKTSIKFKSIIFNFNNLNIPYNYGENRWGDDISNEEMVRYFKGLYGNKERMYNRFWNTKSKENKLLNEIKIWFYDNFDKAKPYTIKEAFEIENDVFRGLVFSSINIPEMVEALGHELHKVDGVKVKRKIYNTEGEYVGDKEYDNVYEVHKVNCERLGVEDSYVVKCWCTSTNKEHWIWIEDKYKDDPLEAIASTFRLPKTLLPYVKNIKRQGDVMLYELVDDFDSNSVEVNTNDLVPLTKEQYFGWLVSET